MKILVVAEHDGGDVRSGSRSAVGFARAVAEETGGEVVCLVLGSGLNEVAADSARYADVVSADDPALADPVADRYSAVISQTVLEQGCDLLVAASTTFAKDIVARAAGLLGGTMASEVVGHKFRDGELLLRRPMFAGAVTATVRLHGTPKIVTIRASAYEPAEPLASAGEITPLSLVAANLSDNTNFECLDSKATGRPDVTEASIVVSGGRAIANSEDYERLIGGLADALGAATGSSRALVDAGITPNDLQVGQTGKIVAPQLYLALGISGAVQHLAGMKNSRVIAAVNTDPDAPIFEVADYGLVADIYQAIPEMTEKLQTPAAV